MRYTRAVIWSMRPRQWTKNLFVFAGLLFTLDGHHSIADFLKVSAAFVLFCIISGSIYLVNDLLDAGRDRLHPVKRLRPIASGKIPAEAAWRIAFLLLASGLTLSFVLSLSFGVAALLYAVLMVAYSIILKDVVILDVLVISAGFVLRAVAGAEAINVRISFWLLVCTTLIALFLGFGKRRAELTGLGAEASNHRPSLEHYTVSYLDQLMSITAACTIMSYALYTFLSETGARHPSMYFTLAFVVYGIFRYLLLARSNAGACAPELLLLRDRPLLVNFVLWMLSCAIIIVFS